MGNSNAVASSSSFWMASCFWSLDFAQNGVVFHFRIFLQSCAYYVGNRTTLLVAQSLSLSHVVVSQSYLDVGNELSQRAMTESGTDSEETLDRQSNNCEQQGLDHRHDDTAFIDGSQEVSGQRVIVRVVVHKVGGVTQHLSVNQNGYDKAANDYDPRRLNASEAYVLFFVFCFHNK